jgi:hypothetical protein
MDEKLSKAYAVYTTLALKKRSTDEELCLALHMDKEAGGELRLTFDEENGKVYVEAVYPDGKYAVLTNWSATASEITDIIRRSDPSKMKQFMLEMLARKDIMYNYPEEE